MQALSSLITTEVSLHPGPFRKGQEIHAPHPSSLYVYAHTYMYINMDKTTWIEQKPSVHSDNSNSKSTLKSLFQPSLFHLTMRSLDLFTHNIFIYSTSHHIFVLVQLLSLVQLFMTAWTAACQASLSFTISWDLLKLISIESVMPSNHLIRCRPLLLPSIFPTISLFQ